jgi:hypothetical protein
MTDLLEDGRVGRIRTDDPLHPMQVRYQTAPLPVSCGPPHPAVPLLSIFAVSGDTRPTRRTIVRRHPTSNRTGDDSFRQLGRQSSNARKDLSSLNNSRKSGSGFAAPGVGNPGSEASMGARTASTACPSFTAVRGVRSTRWTPLIV